MRSRHIGFQRNPQESQGKEIAITNLVVVMNLKTCLWWLKAVEDEFQWP
jgi:hypothetical protein